MANHFFSEYFGLGIIAAIALAFVFPYTAISLQPFAVIFLFFLMFLSGFAIDWSRLKNIRLYIRPLLFGNFLLFVAVPAVIYILSAALLDDALYIYGIVFSALCPAAIIAPFFTGILKGDKELSFLLLVSSSLLSPFVIPPILHVLAGDHANISTALLFKDIIIFVPLPLLCAFFIKKYFGTAAELFSRSLPFFNFALLAILIFILFGASMTKIPFDLIQMKELGILFFIALIQDFFFLLFLGPLQKAMGYEKIIALFASISMKNIAIASTILLLYSPKSAIAPAMGFVAHALLFSPFILRHLVKVSLRQ